jgi:hypothetical protein
MLDTSAKGLQTIIHSIEQGRFAPVLKGAAGLVVLLAIALAYLFLRFGGFDSPDAMDQAQISRSLASGQGFSTKYIRPMALWQLDQAGKTIPTENFPDITQPPLWPVLTTAPLLLTKAHWTISPKDPIYSGDRAIAIFSTLIFLASVVVGYFVARRLFDGQLAAVGCLMVLVTDILWKFSLSGLPQMFVLLLLMVTSWFVLKAMGEQEDAPQAPPLKKWFLQAIIGALFGLMTLSHWVTCWLFFGYLFFAFFYFRPRLLPLAAIALYVLVIAPWLARNFMVCGYPFGLAIYPIGQDDLMRSIEPDFTNLFYGFMLKMRTSIVSQIGEIFGYLGMNLAAGTFFVALFHPFKRPETSKFRWCVLAMWVAAVIGMASYGPVMAAVSTLQLHSVFIPLMAFYGLAFLLVLWNRLGFTHSLMRLVFNTAVVSLAAIPMLLTLFANESKVVQWPPYVPPYIGILGKYYTSSEALCSDMPWAVAWYADRKCILLPDSPETMTHISDYNVLGTPIAGLFLTPITLDQPFMSVLVRGPQKRWINIILRNPQAFNLFPLHAVMGLMEGEILLFSDRDRWSNTTLDQ